MTKQKPTTKYNSGGHKLISSLLNPKILPVSADRLVPGMPMIHTINIQVTGHIGNLSEAKKLF